MVTAVLGNSMEHLSIGTAALTALMGYLVVFFGLGNLDDKLDGVKELADKFGGVDGIKAKIDEMGGLDNVLGSLGSLFGGKKEE